MHKSQIDYYLDRQANLHLTEGYPSENRIDLIVVIPCYNEPDLLKTLDSLIHCYKGTFFTEVIILVNSYLHTTDFFRNINKKTYHDALLFASEKNTANFKIIPLLIENLPGKQTGAGLPRKIGMDEALRRFARINNEQGVIISLDADCIVEENYLSELYYHFNSDKKLCSATINFHHPVKHLPPDDLLRKAMNIYEIYLNYFRAALEYCAYPYPYYTIGSAMAVRATIYAQAGGMGKQEAGEDFYFLQKVFPLGKTKFIASTKVYPAARLSDRVPFGTGPALVKMLDEKEIVKYTYSLESFRVLKLFFEDIDHFYGIIKEDLSVLVKNYPLMLQKFLMNDHFIKTVEEINKNTSSLVSFRKRFFNYFNAFKIIKFLNFVHPTYLPLKDVCREYYEICQYIPEVHNIPDILA